MNSQLGLSRVLWVALFASTLLYIVVLELTALDTTDDWRSLAPMFALAALGSAGASLVAPRFVKRTPSEQTRSSSQSPYLLGLILSLAFAESVAILGLVLGFMGAPAAVVMPFFLATWILMIIRFPTERRLEAFNES
jgi:F0F1-type ATP synthase membrane subunit c/vacuolar-type H+-ATPase subunit K